MTVGKREASRGPQASAANHLHSLELSAQAGDLDAQQQLGDILADGVRDASGRSLIRRNADRAERILRASAEAGHVASYLSLGALLSRRGDTAGARRWIKQALDDRALGGAAASNLATLALEARQYARALAWFDKAYASGDGDAAVDAAYMRYYRLGTRTRHVVAGLARRLKPSATTPFALEEAYYLEAVSVIDQGHLLHRQAVDAMLARANRDGDYPEAGALLSELRAGVAPRIRCRCRRGRPRLWSTTTPCNLHRPRR